MGRGGARKNSGPKKGSTHTATNKMRMDLIETLNDQGVDPAESLAWVFIEAKTQYEKKRDEKNGWGAIGMLDLARHAACDLMDFVYPKRKAIEHTGKEGKDLFQSFADLMKKSVDAKNE